MHWIGSVYGDAYEDTSVDYVGGETHPEAHILRAQPELLSRRMPMRGNVATAG